MDRNTLWASGRSDRVFKHPAVLGCHGPFEYGRPTSRADCGAGHPCSARQGRPSLGLSTPRTGHGKASLSRHSRRRVHCRTPCQATRGWQDDRWCERSSLLRVSLPSRLLPKRRPLPGRKLRFPDKFENAFYIAKVDATTGALASLKLKPSDREMLGGPANVVIAAGLDLRRKDEQHDHEIPPARQTRHAFRPPAIRPQTMRVTTGPLATTVDDHLPVPRSGTCSALSASMPIPLASTSSLTQTMCRQSTMVTAEFPLAEPIAEARRGIPYGFSLGAWAKPNAALHGIVKGINPAIRWSHCTLANGGGVALPRPRRPGPRDWTARP